MLNPHIDLNAPIEDAYRRIAPCFGRSETRDRSRGYLPGLWKQIRIILLAASQLSL